VNEKVEIRHVRLDEQATKGNLRFKLSEGG